MSGSAKGVHLSRKLQLQERQLMPDGAGGATESWSTLGTLWADVCVRTGAAASGSDVPVGRVRYRVVVPGAPVGSDRRPRPGQRFQDGTRVLEIVAVAERDPAGHFLTCFAEEEVVR